MVWYLYSHVTIYSCGSACKQFCPRHHPVSNQNSVLCWSIICIHHHPCRAHQMCASAQGPSSTACYTRFYISIDSLCILITQHFVDRLRQCSSINIFWNTVCNRYLSSFLAYGQVTVPDRIITTSGVFTQKVSGSSSSESAVMTMSCLCCATTLLTPGIPSAYEYDVQLDLRLQVGNSVFWMICYFCFSIEQHSCSTIAFKMSREHYLYIETHNTQSNMPCTSSLYIYVWELETCFPQLCAVQSAFTIHAIITPAQSSAPARDQFKMRQKLALSITHQARSLY